MARGRIKRKGKLVGCCRGGVAPCGDPQELEDTTRTDEAVLEIDAALLDISRFIEKRLGDAGVVGADYQLRAVERTSDGDLIGVRLVPLGPGKLAIAAGVVAGVVTLGVTTAAGGSSGEAPSSDTSRVTSTSEDVRLMESEYRNGLRAMCQGAEKKLELQRGANPDALPVEDLVEVLRAQLDQTQELKPPDALAGTHAALQAATRDRIALLEKVASDDAIAEDDLDALLRQADFAATQMNDAFRALGVAECVQ